MNNCWSKVENDPSVSNINTSSVLNTAPPEGCTSECHLFQERPDDEDLRRGQQALAETEKLIAKDLYQLSSKENQKVLYDIHGVAELKVEDPEYVLQCKNELEIDLVHNQRYSPAFQVVWREAPSYVRGLYTMFLRCDEFNVKKASNRVRTHFDTKLWLFGMDKLCRDITLADFDTFDMTCYNSGLFQVLPDRDRAGRVVQIKLWQLQNFHKRENVWRQIWYNHMTVLKDEETQIKGLVQIIYNVVDNWIEKFDKDLLMGVGKIRAATPIRIVSAHYCFNDPAFGAIIKTVSLALELHTRTRTRLHYGSHLEVLYALQGFGIPIKQLPVNAEGKLRVKEHYAWVKMRRIQEQTRKGNEIIVPSHADVLFGRGKSMQTHIGNLRFSNILEEELERYMGTKRHVKLAICAEIVARIAKYGGRFLRRDDNGVWEEVDEKTAIDKVGHGFRNRKTPERIGNFNQEKRVASRTDKPSDREPVKVSREEFATKRPRFDDDDDKKDNIAREK